MYRSRVILRCVASLVASVALLCVFFTSYLKSPWIGWGVAPVSFVPAMFAAVVLAQRIDKEGKGAVWVGAPTIIAMLLFVGFAFFMFSPVGERTLAIPLVAVLAVVVLAALVTGVFVAAMRWSDEN